MLSKSALLLACASISCAAAAGCGDDTSGSGGGSAGGGDASSTGTGTGTPTGTGTGTGTDAATGTGTSSGTGSASSTGTGSGTGSGGGDGESVTITLDSFTVEPGEEVYKCQNFANPFGRDVHVSEFESHMTPGSHHLLLFYGGDGVDGPLEDCSGLEFAPTPYSTQQSDDSVAYPPGVAAEIPETTGFRVQSHYLNVTPDPIEAQVQVKLHLADDGTVEQLAGVMFMVQPSIHVAPHSTQVVSYDCNVPTDMHVIKAASHMHKHGTKFESNVDGVPFYNTDTWDEPEPALFAPPMDLEAGAPLHFECTFQNDSADTLTFGESAATNEMCILVAAYYPAQPGQPTIGCN